MGLFPPASVVRERHKRNRNLLYTEPDSDNEPGGTQGPRTEGASERRSKHSKHIKRRMEAAREAARGLSRDLQRIEDEMDDEPILSTLLTAGAMRKQRGDASEKRSKERGTDESKGTEEKKIDKNDNEDEDTEAFHEALENQEEDNQEHKERGQPRAQTEQPTSLTLNGLTTQELASELARRCIEAGGIMAINIVEAAQRYLLQLPTIIIAAATQYPHGDAVALALLCVILCDATGRVLTKVNVQRVSFALYGLVVSSGMRIQDAIGRLAGQPGDYYTPIEDVDVLGSAIEASFGHTVVAYTKLSVHFIVGAYSITTIPSFCESIRPRIANFASGLCGLVNINEQSYMLYWAFSILIAVASTLKIISVTHSYMLGSRQSEVNRRITEGIARGSSAISRVVHANRKRRMIKKLALVLGVSSVVADMISGCTRSGLCLPRQSDQTLSVVTQCGLWPNLSDATIGGLLDVIGKPSKTIRMWVATNAYDLGEAATGFIFKIQGPIPKPGSGMSSGDTAQPHEESTEPAQDYTKLESNLKSQLSALQESEDLLKIGTLESTTLQLIGHPNVNIKPWTSFKELAVALQHAKDLVANDRAPMMSLLSASIERIWQFYSQWDSQIQSMFLAANPELGDDTIGYHPDIVVISSLSYRAPVGPMPYERTITGAIKRDDKGDPVQINMRPVQAADADAEMPEMTKRLLAMDRSLLEKQPGFEAEPDSHKTFEEHRYDVARLIARLSGYKGADLSDETTEQLYDLSKQVEYAKSGNTAGLLTALKVLVTAHQSNPEFKAFLPVLDDKYDKYISPYNGPDLVLSAVHRAYEASYQLYTRSRTE